LPRNVALRYAMPWLDGRDGFAAQAVYAHASRQILVKDGRIALVGDNASMQSGGASGQTSYTPKALGGWRWVQ
jgi:hypothetical protein